MYQGILKSIKTGLLSLLLLLSLSGCGYNDFQRTDEAANAAWSEVLNQYQRRADLIPNLVKTVKAYASHEEQVFREVTEARARVGQMQLPADATTNPEAMAQFQQAQGQLGSALSRLLVVAEQYPQLKADQSFRDLQAQLEGTENRITVARHRYIQAIQEYNILIRQFPSNLTAMALSYKTRANFSVENEKAIAKPPEVKF